jgi:hypothetical protein|tara:strand:- start:19 stop:369 length:351 start_codon:yes stop_codon:yes gene_type:complete
MHNSPQNLIISSTTRPSDSPFTISDDKDNSTTIVLKGFTKGIILVPSGSSLTSITYWVSTTEDGTYVKMYLAGDAISTTVAASRAFALDSAIEGAAFLRLQGNAAELAADLHLISS